jgi:ABC-2 type transport system ATP-binding protein
MWEVIGQLVGTGVTVFLTTQYLEEADQLAGRIALLDRGRIVAEGSPADLKRMIPGGHVQLELDSLGDLDIAARRFPGSVRDDDDLTLQITGAGDYRHLRAIVAGLDSDRLTPVSLTVHTPDLDDVFLTLTGHPADQSPELAS